MTDTDRLSIALQRAGALSPSHMTYHDLARCLLAALTDGRDDLGSPDEHDRHMATPLPSDTPADGLDAAWREAEAALPEGWRGPVVRRSRDFPDQYWALAEQEHGDRFREGYAATPTMALRALAFALAALTQEPLSTREEAE